MLQIEGEKKMEKIGKKQKFYSGAKGLTLSFEFISGVSRQHQCTVTTNHIAM
jgi:hypothetical protein